MDSKVEFLFLSQEEMIQGGVLEMPRCIDTMENVFRLLGEKDHLLGGPSGNEHGIKLWFPSKPHGPRMPVDGPDRRFMAMIAYLGGDYHICGTKWYGSNTENPAKHGLPRSVLLVVINDPETGAPLAIMDGNLISAMRTGAVIGLGARYLARRDAEVAGIVAASVISKTCLMALAAELPHLKDIKVFDIDRSKTETFCQEMGQRLGLHVHPAGSIEEAVRDSDVISTATAGANTPLYKNEWVKPGAFFGLSSEPDLEDELWLGSRIVADNWQMHIEWREEIRKTAKDPAKKPIYKALHDLISAGRMRDAQIVEMGNVVTGRTAAKDNEAQKVILVTGGMGTEDVAWGYAVYRQALEKGLGQKLKLWDQPFWK